MAANPLVSAAAQGAPVRPGPPLWLLLELTYRCPLHCAFCYNPTDFARIGRGARHGRIGCAYCAKRAPSAPCSSVCRAANR